jgi:Derlin-2/3
VTSVGALLGVTPIAWLYFSNDLVYTFLSQFWRIWTNFLFTGPNLALLFDTYFLYTYTKALEVDNPRFSKREDVIWYLIFVGGVTTVSQSLQSLLETLHVPSPCSCKTKQTKTPRLSARIASSHNYSGS